MRARLRAFLTGDLTVHARRLVRRLCYDERRCHTDLQLSGGHMLQPYRYTKNSLYVSVGSDEHVGLFRYDDNRLFVTYNRVLAGGDIAVEEIVIFAHNARHDEVWACMERMRGHRPITDLCGVYLGPYGVCRPRRFRWRLRGEIAPGSREDRALTELPRPSGPAPPLEEIHPEALRG